MLMRFWKMRKFFRNKAEELGIEITYGKGNNLQSSPTSVMNEGDGADDEEEEEEKEDE